MYYVSGNTFSHRAMLKALGLRWSPEEKAWVTQNPAAYREALVLTGATKRGVAPRPEVIAPSLGLAISDGMTP